MEVTDNLDDMANLSTIFVEESIKDKDFITKTDFLIITMTCDLSSEIILKEFKHMNLISKLTMTSIQETYLFKQVA